MRTLPLITTLIFSLFFSFAAHGFEISISDFQGEYVKPDGHASAVSDGDVIEFLLNVTDEELTLSVGGEELSLPTPEALLTVNSLKWEGISLDLAESSYDLAIGSFDASTETTDAEIRTGALHCDKSDAELEFLDLLIDSCLSNATLDVERITIWSEAQEELKEVFYELFEKSALSEDDDIQERSKTEFKNVNLDIVNHKVKLSTKADMGIKATLKIEGEIHFDSEQKQVAFRLDKAKASFFNIKDKIFEMVEGMESENITVDRPYIYITMGTSELEAFIQELQ